jgi:hypothetical protein
MKSFYDDLRAFQQKYPMVYVEAWTPEDFVFAARYGSMGHLNAAILGFNDPDEDHNSQLSPDQWADPGHVLTANALAEGFDANDGTNWDRVREALSCPV